jgi:hypothetical protein
MTAWLRILYFTALVGSLSPLAACGSNRSSSGPVDGSPDTAAIDTPTQTCDPSAWRRERLPDDQIANTEVRGIHGTAVDDVWAVTSTGRILHRDAIGWTQTEPVAGALEGVWAADRQTAWVVGRFGFITRWNGSAWETERRADEPNNDVEVLASVHGASPAEVWAVGTGALGGPVVLRRSITGSGWSPVTPPSTALGLHAVWAVGPGHVWVAGEDGLFELENDTWTTQTVRTSFSDVVVLPTGELWALKSVSFNGDALCHSLAGQGGCVAFPGSSVTTTGALAVTGDSVVAAAFDSATGSTLVAELQGTEWTGGPAQSGLAFSVWGASGSTWLGGGETILRRGCD